ncbi:MAG: WYL domain-containing transcriptional regulator [Bacteroidales bacterium]|nr:WYL domain-containing transcriptional regulator [Bacteroidales bacterium]MDZ4204482.1 WYL domain-containing transcriptional regulator [Bacteroidales bacterium]
MTDKEKLQQSLEMLILLSSGTRYTVGEIANRFGVSKKTIYRSLEIFRNVGFVFDPDLPRGSYRIDKNLSENKTLNDLLHFSEEEAWILNKAIHSLQSDNLLKANLIKKLYALYDFERVADTIVKEIHADNVHTLYMAIKDKRQVILAGYRSSNSASITNRMVEPFAFNNGYLSFWAFEPSSNTNKVFKTERVGKAEMLSASWQHQSKHQQADLDVFRISGRTGIPIKVRLSLRACNLLIEEYPLAEKYIARESDCSYLFDGWVCSFEGIGRFAAGLAEDVTIISPIELRVFLTNKLNTAIQIYQRLHD